MEPIVQQRSEEWKAQRLGKVTGSDVANCMAWGAKGKELQARKTYRENLVAERLTGMPSDPDRYVSYDMKWGTASEPMARNMYQLMTNNIVEDAPFVQHETLLCGASPDGYVIDSKTGELGLIEIKCLRSANHLYKVMLYGVPEEHIPQMQMQMWVTGRAWCDFVAFDSRLPEGLRLFIKRVERDDSYIEMLEHEVRTFLDEVDRDFKGFWAKAKGKHEFEIKDGVVKKKEY